LSETIRSKEIIESNLKINDEKMRILNDEKNSLDLKYREQSVKLTNVQLEIESYTALMHQNSKNNALLKVYLNSFLKPCKVKL
jgi:hypothetical protein